MLKVDLMLKGLRNVVVLAGLGLALGGCHSLHALTQSCGKDTDRYMQATSVPPIKVPVGIDPPETRSSLQIPVLNEPEPPPRGSKDACLDAPPKFTEPKGPRPAPAV
jgi:hypothetical protein